MSDPAVEAVRRAQAANGDWPWDTTGDAMETAAREMAKPIREWHEKARVAAENGDLLTLMELVTELAPLIYSPEELTEHQLSEVRSNACEIVTVRAAETAPTASPHCLICGRKNCYHMGVGL